ncbi:DUF359 domain-containing protein [Saccharolobus solfataricus]|uniref:GTP-dependent dephospho-CoA kinase n=3 Tax=Saccharolobus solfataricus TaxID=2287 RepID=DPCKG_SACS2|nr:GTP-dependent dephospho-CoA kinase family protein [Saccharolobus solfataricus]Q980A1.1 RecName: Full=GTP-dependent dephospho-CoA kinase; AltName: Full=Dephospho-coenzyme A kinase; Short=DPCK [Saccharolobus solfataricus P2]AAK40744.1 Conserved hypothetical protein [Saccharolobus solfataricus P2]AKA73721.1 DUF359 domain-containing protein [Saccharolobus solfataricus]AKA76418.1 DUF359 domain-containing protein [Saccharolobus solfataricus]AKA79111.1 DUF359 domain-containing protein [Saccharolob
MEVRNNNKVNLCFSFDNLRNELSRPYGILFINNKIFLEFISKSIQRGSRIITVGDYVSRVLEENGIVPFLEVIDGKTKRTITQNRAITRNKEYKVTNEAGKIRFEIFEIMENILKDREGGVVFVDGEEDLLVIPVTLSANHGDIVIYGQPNAGAVVIIVNEMIRWRVRDILEKAIVKEC